MKQITFFFSLLFLLPQTLTAQHLQLINTRFYGNNNRHGMWMYSTIQTKDKGIAFVGYTDDSGGMDIPICTSNRDHAIMGKLDINGNIQWIKAGCYDHYGETICQTADGGYATNSFDSTYVNGMLINRYDSAGKFLWKKCYGKNARETHTGKIITTPDNGFLVLGFSLGNDSDIPYNYTYPPVAFQPSDWVLIKLDSLGNKQWVRVLGTSGDERTAQQLVCDGKNYYLIGETESKDHDCADVINHPGYAIYTIKLDSAGNVLWSKAHGQGGTVIAAQYDERDNSIVIGGYTGGSTPELPNNHGDEDMYLMKLDTAGNWLWANQFGDSNNEELRGFCKGIDNSYVLVGTSERNITLPPPYIDYYDGWIFWVDSVGKVIDQKIFGGYSGDQPVNVFPSHSGFEVLGASNSHQFFEGTGTNFTYAGVFLSQFDIWTTGISTSVKKVADFVVAPNPAHNSFEVQFTLPAAGQLSCINTAGQTVLRRAVTAQETSVTIATDQWAFGNYIVCWQPLQAAQRCKTITIR